MPRDKIRFRRAFAIFLRRYPQVWRLRRRDHLIPLDFYLAQRQITLHGCIEAQLLEEFKRTTPEVQVSPEFEAGKPFYLHVPFATFPKQLLLDFSSWDASGNRVALLTRAEGAKLSAAHLLNLFPQGSFPQNRTGRLGAQLLLETIAAVDPESLLFRIRRWRSELGERKAERYIPQLEHFADWLNAESDDFAQSLSMSMRPQVAATLAKRAAAFPILEFGTQLPDEGESQSLVAFRSIATLALFGVRESLRILADEQSHGRIQWRTPRHELLAEQYEHLALRGLRELERMTTANLRPGSRVATRALRDELVHTAGSWMAYIVAPVTLEQPFNLRSSELLAFQKHKFVKRQLFRIRTNHTYRTYPGDARSNHIEVSTQDAELIIGTKQTRVRHAQEKFVKPESMFGREFRDSDTIAHLYTAAAPWEEPLRSHPGPIWLRVPYRLTRSIFWGHVLLCAVLAVVVGWASVEWLGNTPPSADAKTAIFTVTGGFAFLTALLTTVTHRKPLVQGKLMVFRVIISAALIAVVAEPVLSWLGWI